MTRKSIMRRGARPIGLARELSREAIRASVEPSVVLVKISEHLALTF